MLVFAIRVLAFVMIVFIACMLTIVGLFVKDMWDERKKEKEGREEGRNFTCLKNIYQSICYIIFQFLTSPNFLLIHFIILYIIFQ